MKTNTTKLSTLLVAACATLVFSCSESKQEDAKNDWDNSQTKENVDQAATEARNDAEHAGDRIEANADEASADWQREREEMRAEIDRKIEKNDRDIAELKADAKAQKKEARKEYEEKVNNLEKKNREMKARYNDNKADTREGWDNFKKEFNHDMDQLGTSIGDLFRDNKKNK